MHLTFCPEPSGTTFNPIPNEFLGGSTVVATQGLQGIAFFEATVCLTLLVLFIHLKRDNTGMSYRLWLVGWIGLTISSFCELAMFYRQYPVLRIAVSAFGVAALWWFWVRSGQPTWTKTSLTW